MAFRDDDRAQSVQVGAVLLFAVLVILLAGYQSTVVPNDNRAAEFDHSLEAEEDMLDVRNAIIEAYQDGEASPVSVRLGMTYPRHTFGIDPAPVGGTLRTEDAGNIRVTEDGEQVSVCPVSNETKYLNYSADYNYYSPAPTLVYENTVLYADYGDGRRVFVSDQSLISGDTVNLVALQGEYSENGISAIDFKPRAGGRIGLTYDQPNITIPTRLSVNEWEQLLDATDSNVEITKESPNSITFNHQNDDVLVVCSAIGANKPPSGGERSASEGDDGNEVNPAGSGEVVLRKSTILNNTAVNITFENTGDNSINATSARLSFHYPGGQGQSRPPADYVTVSDGGTQRGNLTVAGQAESLDPRINFDHGIQKTITFNFESDSGVKLDEDYFVLKIYFEDGSSNMYFIAPQSGGSGTGGGPPGGGPPGL